MSRPVERASVLFLAAVWLGAAACHGATTGGWPQWRGPNRDGVAIGVALPATWPKALPQAWARDVGLGYSAPVVADGKVVVMARQGDDEVTQCFNATDGTPLWRNACAAPYKPHLYARKHGKGPFATPAIAGGKVYSLGISGTLSCLALDSGKVLWRKTFADQFGKPYPTWGASNSPLVEGGLCIAGIGSTQKGYVAAFDRDTGEQRWALKADGPGYGSAIVANVAGTRQMVALTSTKVVGAAVADGRLLWEIPFKTSYEQNSTTPVVHGDTVIFAGYNLGARAFRFTAKAGSFTGEKLWENKKAPMYMSSPVLVGQHVYGLAQRRGGTLVCLAAADGTTAWSSPGRLGEYASLVAAGNILLVLTTEGELLVVAADPAAYKQIARLHITDQPTWAHLAVVPGRLYVKDKTRLLCLALPTP